MACFPETLEHAFKGGGTLKIECGCGHKVEVPKENALAVFGPGADPMAIRRRLKCSVCGKKGPGKVWV